MKTCVFLLIASFFNGYVCAPLNISLQDQIREAVVPVISNVIAKNQPHLENVNILLYIPSKAITNANHTEIAQVPQKTADSVDENLKERVRNFIVALLKKSNFENPSDLLASDAGDKVLAIIVALVVQNKEGNADPKTTAKAIGLFITLLKENNNESFLDRLNQLIRALIGEEKNDDPSTIAKTLLKSVALLEDTNAEEENFELIAILAFLQNEVPSQDNPDLKNNQTTEENVSLDTNETKAKHLLGLLLELERNRDFGKTPKGRSLLDLILTPKDQQSIDYETAAKADDLLAILLTLKKRYANGEPIDDINIDEAKYLVSTLNSPALVQPILNLVLGFNPDDITEEIEDPALARTPDTFEEENEDVEPNPEVQNNEDGGNIKDSDNGAEDEGKKMTLADLLGFNYDEAPSQADKELSAALQALLIKGNNSDPLLTEKEDDPKTNFLNKAKSLLAILLGLDKKLGTENQLDEPENDENLNQADKELYAALIALFTKGNNTALSLPEEVATEDDPKGNSLNRTKKFLAILLGLDKNPDDLSETKGDSDPNDDENTGETVKELYEALLALLTNGNNTASSLLEAPKEDDPKANFLAEAKKLLAILLGSDQKIDDLNQEEPEVDSSQAPEEPEKQSTDKPSSDAENPELEEDNGNPSQEVKEFAAALIALFTKPNNTTPSAVTEAPVEDEPEPDFPTKVKEFLGKLVGFEQNNDDLATEEPEAEDAAKPNTDEAEKPEFPENKGLKELAAALIALFNNDTNSTPALTEGETPSEDDQRIDLLNKIENFLYIILELSKDSHNWKQETTDEPEAQNNDQPNLDPANEAEKPEQLPESQENEENGNSSEALNELAAILIALFTNNTNTTPSPELSEDDTPLENDPKIDSSDKIKEILGILLGVDEKNDEEPEKEEIPDSEDKEPELEELPESEESKDDGNSSKALNELAAALIALFTNDNTTTPSPALTEEETNTKDEQSIWQILYELGKNFWSPATEKPEAQNNEEPKADEATNPELEGLPEFKENDGNSNQALNELYAALIALYSRDSNTSPSSLLPEENDYQKTNANKTKKLLAILLGLNQNNDVASEYEGEKPDFLEKTDDEDAKTKAKQLLVLLLELKQKLDIADATPNARLLLDGTSEIDPSVVKTRQLLAILLGLPRNEYNVDDNTIDDPSVANAKKLISTINSPARAKEILAILIGLVQVTAQDNPIEAVEPQNNEAPNTGLEGEIADVNEEPNIDDSADGRENPELEELPNQDNEDFNQAVKELYAALIEILTEGKNSDSLLAVDENDPNANTLADDKKLLAILLGLENNDAQAVKDLNAALIALLGNNNFGDLNLSLIDEQAAAEDDPNLNAKKIIALVLGLDKYKPFFSSNRQKNIMDPYTEIHYPQLEQREAHLLALLLELQKKFDLADASETARGRSLLETTSVTGTKELLAILLGLKGNENSVNDDDPSVAEANKLISNVDSPARAKEVLALLFELVKPDVTNPSEPSTSEAPVNPVQTAEDRQREEQQIYDLLARLVANCNNKGSNLESIEALVEKETKVKIIKILNELLGLEKSGTDATVSQKLKKAVEALLRKHFNTVAANDPEDGKAVKTKITLTALTEVDEDQSEEKNVARRR